MPSSTFNPVVLALSFSLLIQTATADILVLKNGTRIEGTILGQSEQGVRMRYRLTPKIMDDKVFAASKIAEIIKQSPQELELADLRALLPTKDLQPSEFYEELLQTKLYPFARKYAGTKEAAEAAEITATLEKELQLIKEGHLKIENRWLSPREAMGEKFHIEALQIVTSIRQKGSQGDFIGALREFDRLHMPAPGHRGSFHSLEVIPDVILYLERWLAQLDRMSAEQEDLGQQRQRALDKLNATDRSRQERLLEDEYMKWRATVEAERRQQIRWFKPYKYNAEAIQQAKRDAIDEISTLRSLPMQELREIVNTASQCYRHIGSGDYLSGASAFEKLCTMNLPVAYRDLINDTRNRLLQLHAKLSNAAFMNPTTAGTPGNPAATRSNPDPGTVSAADAAAKAAIPSANDKDVSARTAEILRQNGISKPAAPLRAP